MKIPFVDLKIQYINYKKEIDDAIASVINQTAFVGGSNNKFIQKFEADFANFLGMKHVVSCANGTDSIEILLEAFGIKAGDEVIVPAVSWVSTSEAVGRIGAKPIFIDVDKDTLLINTNLIEKKISANTKAIIPVHLYGNAVNMDEIMRISKKYNLIVIEDCAQSHGSRYNGKLSGTFGHASSFSFYPGKNLGAYGDAGAIVTGIDEIALKCKMIANHGQLEKHNHVIEGRNSRMDGIHAAILSVKLNYLNEWNKKRQENADYYSSTIKNLNIKLPTVNESATHVYHLYVIESPLRDDLKKHLANLNIETAIHYPEALPFLKAYEKFNFKPSDFPVAHSVTKKILSIPMFPELNREQMDIVVTALNNFNG